MEKLTINIPEGYSGIDMEKSDLDKGIIVFKKKPNGPWKDSDPKVVGFFINTDNALTKQETPIKWREYNRNIFATKKQAKSVQAMSELSQIMANDKRFGDPITDEEWNNPTIIKYVIGRQKDCLFFDWSRTTWCFFAFRTEEQRELFYQENEDLIRQYYMLD